MSVWHHARDECGTISSFKMSVSQDYPFEFEGYTQGLHPGYDVQVMSGDESGTICMWSIQTGGSAGHFKSCHGSSRLTAMTLDSHETHLLTGSNNGELKLWEPSANSARQVQQFVHGEEQMEHSTVMFVHDADRQSTLVSLLSCSHAQHHMCSAPSPEP